MKEEVNVLFKEEQLMSKIREIADQINRDYEGKEVYLLCILKGSVYFTCELSKYIKVPVKLGFLSVSSYGDGMTSSGAVELSNDVDLDVKGKNVIVVEDIVDSGRTLAFLLHMLAKRKPESRVTEVTVDYVGFEVPDVFVVGFGMDYAQKYRNLPYIGELVFKEGK